MDIKDFIEKLIDAIEIEDSSALTDQTKFRELDEWSSLSILSLIALADEEFGKEISGQDIRSAQTIQDLYDLFTK